MKLTAQIKLLPTKEQEKFLIATLETCNKACGDISEIAWAKKVFNQFKLHKESYYSIKEKYSLSAQLVVRCISKVADSYKIDKKVKREFKKHGSIAYDSRVLSYNIPKSSVNIWTVGSRQRMSFTTGEHQKKILEYQKGESDLCYIKGKFFLLVTCDIPDTDEKHFSDIIGVDLGITDIATTSDGVNYSGAQIKQVREKRNKVRNSIQTKADNSPKRSTQRNCRKLNKRLSGRERRFGTITNHSISKQIVAKAVEENSAIAMENLKGIKKRVEKDENGKRHIRKSQRRTHSSWSFYQLKTFVKYKAERAGVKVFEIPPAYTSKTCHKCKHIGNRAGKVFKCKNEFCEYTGDADVNGACNIRSWGHVVNCPEKSVLFCEVNITNVISHTPLLGLKHDAKSYSFSGLQPVI